MLPLPPKAAANRSGEAGLAAFTQMHGPRPARLFDPPLGGPVPHLAPRRGQQVLVLVRLEQAPRRRTK